MVRNVTLCILEFKGVISLVSMLSRKPNRSKGPQRTLGNTRHAYFLDSSINLIVFSYSKLTQLYPSNMWRVLSS